MGKRKKKNNINTQQQNTKEPITISVNDNTIFSAEEWQHIIANAIVEAEEIKAQKEEKLKQQKKDELQRQLESEKKLNIFKRIWLVTKRAFKLMFISKKEVTGDHTSITLLRGSMYSFWYIVEMIMYLFAGALLFSIPAHYISDAFEKLIWSAHPVVLLYSLMFFILARIFRIIKFEAEKIEDKNYLLALFASVTALISAVTAIISLFK